MNRITRTFKANIDARLVELQVLACVPLSGMCDACAFTAANCFTAMVTGNTLFVALGASYQPKSDPFLWLRSLTGLGAFWFGCFCFARLRYFGAKRKGVLFFSMMMQAILVFICAAISQARKVPGFDARSLGPASSDEAIDRARIQNQRVLIPLALMGFQAGGQIVTSRVLQINEVPINVLTSLYCDFFSDPALFSLDLTNQKRTRRFIAILGYFGGVIGAGWLMRSKGGIPAVLWLVAGVKTLLAISWLLWFEEKPKNDELDEVKV